MLNLTSPINWRKNLLPAIAVLIAAVLVALFLVYYPQIKKFVVKPTPVPTPKIEVITTENGKLPPSLPKDIVLEKDVRVSQSNYTEPFPYGLTGMIYQIQSQFSFASQKSLSENYSLYTKYFKDNKWQVTDSINKNDLKRLSAFKDSDKVSVTMSANSLTKESTVTIQGIHIGTYRSLNKSSPSPSPTVSPR